jgi:hypothetical protein
MTYTTTKMYVVLQPRLEQQQDKPEKIYSKKKTSPKISSRFDRYVNDIFAIRYALLLRQNGKNLKIYIDDVYLFCLI